MDMKKLIESLSPNELKILPYLEEKNINDVCKKANLDKTSVMRALEYLSNKKILTLNYEKKKIVEIGINGSLYRKKGLPERRLLNLLDEKRILTLNDAQKISKLSKDEFKASIGALKKKALIELKKGKIIFSGDKQEISKKSPEELLLEILPVEYNKLSDEYLYAFNLLKNRKNILGIKEETKPNVIITQLGKKLMESGIKTQEMIEQVTPEILKKETSWKGKKFRRYDISSEVPEISGGKRHFVNQAIDHARKIWTEMGFKEMTGSLIQSSFWNFDVLFTAQDHSVREMQDTFFINKKIKQEDLANKELVKSVKKAHEIGVAGSKGWQYNWDEDEAKKLVLRTHTTCLSAETLANLKPKDLPAKFFALGKCFRNETLDWGHGFEFNQTEGIVIGKELNLNHLLAYLKEFFRKMGFKKIRWRPSFFAFTEPSLEIEIYHSEKKCWLEVAGAGILRPEVTIPLLGQYIPVLAWGIGFDRIIMDYYNIKDIRELNKNDLSKLRDKKFWMRY